MGLEYTVVLTHIVFSNVKKIVQRQKNKTLNFSCGYEKVCFLFCSKSGSSYCIKHSDHGQ